MAREEAEVEMAAESGSRYRLPAEGVRTTELVFSEGEMPSGPTAGEMRTDREGRTIFSLPAIVAHIRALEQRLETLHEWAGKQEELWDVHLGIQASEARLRARHGFVAGTGEGAFGQTATRFHGTRREVVLMGDMERTVTTMQQTLDRCCEEKEALTRKLAEIVIERDTLRARLEGARTLNLTQLHEQWRLHEEYHGGTNVPATCDGAIDAMREARLEEGVADPLTAARQTIEDLTKGNQGLQREIARLREYHNTLVREPQTSQLIRDLRAMNERLIQDNASLGRESASLRELNRAVQETEVASSPPAWAAEGVASVPLADLHTARQEASIHAMQETAVDPLRTAILGIITAERQRVLAEKSDQLRRAKESYLVDEDQRHHQEALRRDHQMEALIRLEVLIGQFFSALTYTPIGMLAIARRCLAAASGDRLGIPTRRDAASQVPDAYAASLYEFVWGFLCDLEERASEVRGEQSESYLLIQGIRLIISAYWSNLPYKDDILP